MNSDSRNKKPVFIKFDGVHPFRFLNEIKQKEAGFIRNLSRQEYHQWLFDKKINYSDFYAYNLSLHGWKAEEFIYNDPLYFEKTAEMLFGSKKAVLKLKEKIKNKVRPSDKRWEKFIVKEYIRNIKPDVIFVREGNPFPSSFWSEFKKDSLLVNRIAMNFPLHWNPGYFDLIFTSLEHYKTVFEINGIPSYLFYDGFDQRISEELKNTQKIIDVSHAGGAGKDIFKEKTKLFEAVAEKHDFHWYGWGQEKLDKNSALLTAWKGYISGMDMYRLYKQSRIVLNDYGNIAKGVAVNQRLYEVLGVGSFLLTRYAKNLESAFPKDIFITFTDEKDCLDKINYYLKNEKEREEIAKAGQQYALENLNYIDLMGKMDNILRKHLAEKFPGKHYQ